MARMYTAVMALLATVVVLLQGVKNGAGFDGTMSFRYGLDGLAG